MFVASSSWVLQLTSVSLLLAAVYLFRNPKIAIERFEKCEILSVCDGVVANIETIDCQGKIKGECYKVTVLNRLIDKGEFRAPFDSKITFLEYRRGMQLALYSKKSNVLNEESKILFQSSDEKDDVMVVKQRLNRFNIPLSFRQVEGDELVIGERYGFMLHGSVTLFLPTHSRLAIKVGDEIKAGQSLIGYFMR